MRKCYTKLLLFLPLFIFCCALLKSSSASAATYTITSGTVYRAFSACPSQGACTYTANNSAFSSVPTSALQSRENNVRYLNGFFTSGTISQGSSNYSVNSITSVYFVFTQEDTVSGICGSDNTSIYWNSGLTDSSMRPRLRLYNGSTLLNVQYPASVSCSTQGNLVEIDVLFSGFSTTDNTPINTFDFKWGDISTPVSFTPAITGIRASNGTPSSSYGGSVNYLGMVYDYTTSNDPNSAYQSTIINQNNTMINNQQQIINNQNAQAQQDQQDRDNITDAKEDGDDAAQDAADDSQQATASLLATMGSILQALGTNATDCKVDADLGNLDLGEIDYCTGKPAALTPILNTVCVLIMSIPIYLIARDLMVRFIAITTYAQGGDADVR